MKQNKAKSYCLNGYRTDRLPYKKMRHNAGNQENTGRLTAGNAYKNPQIYPARMDLFASDNLMQRARKEPFLKKQHGSFT
jgi:hypothetical protein